MRFLIRRKFELFWEGVERGRNGRLQRRSSVAPVSLQFATGRLAFPSSALFRRPASPRLDPGGSLRDAGERASALAFDVRIAPVREQVARGSLGLALSLSKTNVARSGTGLILIPRACSPV